MATPGPEGADVGDPSSTDSVVTSAENGHAQSKENLQGPYWKVRLKPVKHTKIKVEGDSCGNVVSTGSSKEDTLDMEGSQRPRRYSDGDRAGARDQTHTEGDGEHQEHMERPAFDGKRFQRDDRLEEQKIRERLKAMPMWKKELVDRKKTGPLVAKASVMASNNSAFTTTAATNSTKDAPANSKGSSIPLPAQSESAFTRQVVNSKQGSPGVPRKRVSPSNSFKSSGGRRTPSPHSVIEGLSQEGMRKRVERVRKARLYLLQQTGPNSFLIGGDSPEHKFRVIIGTQTCSCGKGPHCLHLLFVMLRVFQVGENDPCLWRRELKNYEVETLFRAYLDRRNQRMKQTTPKNEEKKGQEAGGDSTSPDTSSTDSESSTKDIEETCPICLLEMCEGESIVECEKGCHNKLHHHCISIWFNLCQKQKEPLMCPLCRAKWKVSPEEGVTVPSGSPAVSLPHPPPPAQPHEEVVLPHADPLPQEHRDMAAPWIEILGEDLISCLFSKNWTVRETGLRRVSQEAVAVFLPASGEGRTGARVSSDRHEAKTQMLSTCFSILALMCGDPVYRVFVAALKTLRTVLAYVPCRDDTQRKELQDLLVPVLNTILIKCADGNRRTSLLSISTIVELGKGQSGELAIGREIFNSGQGGIGGVSFILTCMLEEYTLEEVQWQWLLGRLCALDRLMEEFPLEFTVEAARGEHISDHPRLHAVLNFVFKALKHSHQRIAKLARRTFIFAVRPTAHIPGIFSEVKEMLNHLDSSLHIRMLRHLAHIFTEPALLVPYHNITYQNGPVVDFEIPGDMGEGSDTPRSLSPDMPLPSSQGSSPMPQTPTEDGDCNDGIGEDNRRLDNMTPNNNELGSDLQNNNVPNDNDVEEQTHQDEFLGENGLEASVQPDEAAAGSKSAIAQDNHVDGDTKKLEETTDKSNVNGELPGNAENHVSGTKTAKDANRNLKQTNPVLLTPPNTPLQQSLDKEEVSLSAKKVPQSESTSSPLAGAQPKDWGDITTKQLECDCIEPPQPHGVHMHHKSQGNMDQEEIQPSLPSCGENAHHKAQGYGNCDDRQDEAQAAPLNCNCLIKPCPCEDKFRLPQEPCSPKKTYLCSACRRYSILSTEDSTELTLSPAGLDEKPVSFKTEVASSPRVSPDASQDDGASSDPCYCKEEVEIEEAQALAAAMEASTKQEDLPIIPQLGSREKDEITIHIQDEGGGENDEPQPKAYLDGIHWQRGPLIGTGAYSTCYQARDVKTGTIMAVKQISFCRNTAVEQAQVVEAIEDEIRMMAKLNHVNVVRILGATRQGCHFNMFVEWMPGGAVACLLATYGPFSEVVITSYTQQVLRGLAYLHDNQILHRDMKGANILVDSTGKRVRIADFGASARLATRSTGAGEFQGQLLGTIAFMAPEVLRGESYGRSCDVWSVGCCMVEMCTGQPPWGSKAVSNHLALIFKIATSTEPPPIPENLSPGVRDLMLRCLEQKSEDRPSAKELLQHPLFIHYHNFKSSVPRM